MIMSKKDLMHYLIEDKKALGAGGIKDYFIHDIWRFQRILRKTEYKNNTAKNKLQKVIALIYRYRLSRYGRKLGFSIPVNTFGAGLSIAHRGTIVVNGNERVGQRCRIHVCVNIGASASNSNDAPILGNDCYIAPGVKIYGDVILGDNTAIGANAVVNKSFPKGNQTIAGMPANVISEQGPLQFRTFSVEKTNEPNSRFGM